jgi:hypothetical protein
VNAPQPEEPDEVTTSSNCCNYLLWYKGYGAYLELALLAWDLVICLNLALFLGTIGKVELHAKRAGFRQPMISRGSGFKAQVSKALASLGVTWRTLASLGLAWETLALLT